MVKIGLARFNDWTSLLLGRSATKGNEEGRYTRILQGIAAGVAGKGISVLVNFLSVPLTVGYLGSERYGVWMTISALLGWLSIADLGLGNSLTNAIAESYAKNERDLARRYVASVFWALSGAALLLAGLSALAWRWINWSAFLNVSSSSAGEVGPAVAVTLAVFLFNFPLSVVSRVLCAHQESAVANHWNTAGSVASLGGLLLATHFKWGLVPLIGAYSASTLLVTAASAVWLFGFHKPWLKPYPREVRVESVTKLLGVGGMFFVAQIASIMIMQTDNVVIAHYLGAQAVTPYSVTWRLFSCSTLLQTLLMQSLWPAYTEAYTRRDGAWIRQALRLSLIVSILSTLVIVLPLLFFGSAIIKYWAGAEAVPSTTLLLLMSLWSITLAALSPLACMLNGVGRVRVQMTFGTATAITNIVLSIVLVSVLGVEGVILATIVSYFLFAVIPFCAQTKSVLSELSN